jgi:hypothetical protein
MTNCFMISGPVSLSDFSHKYACTQCQRWFTLYIGAIMYQKECCFDETIG